MIIQAIGFIGVLFFLISYQVKTNRALFFLQTIGCLLFCLQYILLKAYSGCIGLIINIVRNTMLSKYKEYKWIRWKGWVIIFSLSMICAAVFTWDGFKSILPVIGTISSTAAYWTNNARTIRVANLTLNAPYSMAYDVIVKSWGGVLNEAITITSIIVSIFRFGWKALDGDNV